MTEPTICTIFTKNKLAHVRTLAQSFFAQHPNGHMVALLVDESDGYFDPAAEPFEIVAADAINISGFGAMTMRYAQQELCAAVKPYFLAYLLQERGYARICYFDPEMTIHGTLDNLFQLLETKLMVLTPYLLDPIPADRFQPDEKAILQWGSFNLGFLGLAQHAECERVLSWWQQQTARHCLIDPTQGLYLDQRWMNLAPTLFADVQIQRDPGCGVGHWNLGQRYIRQSDAGYTANGAPLIFFHHYGFMVDNVEGIAYHQNRYTLSDWPQLRVLIEHYRERLLANGYRTVTTWPYSYAYFDNGVAIPDVLRQIWRHTKVHEVNWPEPRQTDDGNAFLHWLNEPDDVFTLHLGEHIGIAATADGQPRLTNLAMAVYRLRPDCQERFPNPIARDRTAFARWFVDEAAPELELDPYFVEPLSTPLVRSTASPVRRTLQRLNDRIESWVYDIYRQGVWMDQMHEKSGGLLTKGPLGNFLERAVTRKLSQKNYGAPSPAATAARTPIIRVSAPFGVNVAGFLRESDALGIHARDILAALHQQGVPVAYVNVPGHPDHEQDYALLQEIPRGAPYAINLLYTAATQLYPHDLLGDQFFADHYNIGFLWGDSGRFPQAWQHACSRYHELWVGSQFVKAMLMPISTQPIQWMPLAIPPMEPGSHSRADLKLPADKQVFLFVFDPLSAIERKNPQAVIEAYRAAFAPHFDDTCLVLKAKHLERFPTVMAELQQALDAVGGLLINRTMPRAELVSLFHTCDAYVSLHRAEGYGATLAEAMLLGKPVIATGYSGNMDFMTPENSYPIAYALKELAQDVGILGKGSRWAEADIADAARAMRCVVANPIEAQRKGQMAQQYIQANYSPEAVAKAMLKRLEAIHAHSTLCSAQQVNEMDPANDVVIQSRQSQPVLQPIDHVLSAEAASD